VSLVHLLVVPLMAALGAFVKNAHGFIGTANLHLQKVSLVVVAGWTDGHGPIDIGPGGGTAQNVVHLFLGRCDHLDGPRWLTHHGTGVRTGPTVKTVPRTLTPVLSDLLQQCYNRNVCSTIPIYI
jgi:hypothetical protein